MRWHGIWTAIFRRAEARQRAVAAARCRRVDSQRVSPAVAAALCRRAESQPHPSVEPASRRRRVRVAAGLLAILGLFAGCRSVIAPRDAAGDLYYKNWWNFYRRGVAALEKQQFDEARDDFEICLGIRGGAKFGMDEEQWRIRTYGLHMLEGYFPNRELGVAYFHLGAREKAESFLTKSMGKTPSGRAKHYLNLIREDQLKTAAVAPPRIDATGAGKLAWTRLREERVSGKAAGAGLIRVIEIDGKPEFIELAEAERAFDRVVSLHAGTNVVTITARDLKGQATTARVGWVADWQPPRLAVTRLERDGAEWVVHAMCRDDNGVASVTLDGQPYSVGAAAGTARVPVVVRVAAGRQPVLVAADLAGNRMQTVLAPAKMDQDLQASLAPQLALASEPGSVSDAGSPVLPAAGPGAAAGADTTRPTLALGDLGPLVKVFDAEFFLDGRASDAGGLAKVAVNGHDVLDADTRGALQSTFAQRLALAPGTNTVELLAEDLAGNRTERRLIVVRAEPEYLNESFRIAVVVPPVVAERAGPVTEAVKRSLDAEVLRDPPRFHLLEREEGWDAILSELRLSVSDLADPRAALRVGRLLSADLLVQASLLAIGKGQTVYARVIDAETAEVLVDADVYSERGDVDLDWQIEGLVMKIEQHFPLLSGGITRVAGHEVTIDAGADSGVSPQTRFIVVSRGGGADGMRAGEVRKVDGRMVELKVKRLKGGTGITDMLPSGAVDVVQEGDYVYAR